MGYLITHIAAFLVFAQLLGLLLGWLLWGYPARQRSREVKVLRERLADMPPSRLAFMSEPRASLAPGAEMLEPAAAIASLPLDDLEAEVKEEKIRHLEKQVRELEGVRERLPILQAQLNDSVQARMAADGKLAATTSDLGARVENLLGQIRQFEEAAAAWDRKRDEFETASISTGKELAAAKAQVRDMQNNQLPQRAELRSSTSALSPMEHADLRERYQKALLERDGLAAQLGSLRQQGGSEAGSTLDLSGRVASLEEALQTKEASLADQASQVETLLWRVAELEPFALAVPRMEENLRRQESEISGHVAMHGESAEHIRSLLTRAQELEAASAQTAGELAAREANLRQLTQEQAGRIAELQGAADVKDQQLAEIAAARAALSSDAEKLREHGAQLERQLLVSASEVQQLKSAHEKQVEAEWQLSTQRNRELEARVAELSEQRAMAQSRLAELEQLTELEKRLRLELAAAGAAHAALSSDAEKLRGHSDQLEQQLLASAGEIQQLNSAHEKQAGEISALEASREKAEARVAELSEQHAQAQNRLAELEQVAARSPEMERQLADLEGRLRQELAALSGNTEKLRVHGAQLEQQLLVSASEIEHLSHAHEVKNGEISALRVAREKVEAEWQLSTRRNQELEARIAGLSEQLASAAGRLAELEPLAARSPEIERKLADMEDRHQQERTRLQINSAQRLRRLRQGITNFRG